KAQAKRARSEAGCEPEQTPPSGLLADIPLALPGLTRAVKLQARAASVGFDWNDARLVLEKIREETEELEAVLNSGGSEEIEDEAGDLLFAVANFCRHAHADPEAAIRRANAKFERRFGFIEETLAQQGRSPAEAGLEEMESLWERAKRSETG
ncbi:MAG: nucleoside triphosphate pyrophosphohydrolase, partial [Methylocapsa sp.]|nr:nucleoside triphosphate pyrophosphohydrolase [Methylocapsa sp.]